MQPGTREARGHIRADNSKPKVSLAVQMLSGPGWRVMRLCPIFLVCSMTIPCMTHLFQVGEFASLGFAPLEMRTGANSSSYPPRGGSSSVGEGDAFLPKHAVIVGVVS